VARVDTLGKQKAAPIAEIGIVAAELMAVIAQRQGLWQRAGERLEPAEMLEPGFVREIAKADPFGPALVAMTQDSLGKIGGADGVEKIRAEVFVAAGGGELGHGFYSVSAPALCKACLRRHVWRPGSNRPISRKMIQL